jgi:hypothetical protein
MIFTNTPLITISRSITKTIEILKYKFIQYNLLLFITFFFVYWILYKINKEEHFTYDKSYNMTSIIDIMYFTLTTQTTIGYGDITPRSKIAKSIMMIHITFTIILLGLISA